MFSLNWMKMSSHLLKRCLNSEKISNVSKYSTTFSFIKSQQKINQNLVIDLSFEDLMTSEECHRLAVDLYSVHTINSDVSEDNKFEVNLCHQLSNDSIVIEYLRHYLPNLETLDNFHIHNESYLNLFDTKRLVYLSPDSKDLIKFDSNDIYIIGGVVQKKIFKRESSRLTYSKGKKEGLRTGRLPLDHLTNRGMKRGVVLFVPQIFNILSDVKSGNSWESAARRYMPSWKLKPLLISHYPLSLTQDKVFPKIKSTLLK